ncbi:hypothetical protein BDP55DRAFT_631494 [Colletotrichum godetiae]|uniref:C2H2-type domain-containing protein n=1 Tax=Colletotrichum godetiae TaxID=1209918 RepID=A0AAJ0ALX9_9PEZI|nr:uncharacterized protein BDP55DRAFT_631494 [Colletotrichum godetiae]KAK1676331.1 hypothetical protein BDP55DRAFT_631494 [Colletotrichum godetiae]
MSVNGATHTNGASLTNGYSHTNGMENPSADEGLQTDRNMQSRLRCYYGYCGRTFANGTLLLTHEATHNQSNNTAITFFCTFDGCPRSFDDAKNWRNHEENDHPSRFNTGIHWVCGQNTAAVGEGSFVVCNLAFTHQEQKEFVTHLVRSHHGRVAPEILEVGKILMEDCYPGNYEGFWCPRCAKALKFSSEQVYERLRRRGADQNSLSVTTIYGLCDEEMERYRLPWGPSVPQCQNSARSPLASRRTLTTISAEPEPRESGINSAEVSRSSSIIKISTPKASRDIMSGLNNFELVKQGVLQPEQVSELQDVFSRKYHPYCPISLAPFLIQPGLKQLQKRDYFLLAVSLTVASRDSPEHGIIQHYCWNHVRSLLLQVLLSYFWTQTPRTVEGLLLLSEWLPDIEKKGSTSEFQKDHFSGGRTTWSIVGLAVRWGYSLRLDRAAFRGPASGYSVDERQEQNRLIWMFLSSKLTAKDFPTLKPEAGSSTDGYASVLHAHLDLMQTLHNAHSILYSATEKTQSTIQQGDYPRYLGDLMEAAMAWSVNREDFQVSPKMKSTLRLSHEYHCLYINTFSFHAVVTREAQPQGYMNYLFNSMWPELVNSEHHGDSHDFEGELLCFDLDPSSGFESL